MSTGLPSFEIWTELEDPLPSWLTHMADKVVLAGAGGLSSCPSGSLFRAAWVTSCITAGSFWKECLRDLGRSLSGLYDSHSCYILLVYKGPAMFKARKFRLRLWREECHVTYEEHIGWDVWYMLVCTTLLVILASFSPDQGIWLARIRSWSDPQTLPGVEKEVWLPAASEGKDRSLELSSHQDST